MVKREICRPPLKPPDNLNDRLKASKRRVNPIRSAERKLPSICGPPPKPPDRQNSLNHKHETKRERKAIQK